MEDISEVVRSLGTSAGCLWCNGLIDWEKLSEEVLSSDEQRQNQRYVDDPDVAAPSVITINAMGAGWALNDFMQYANGLGGARSGFRVLRTRPVGEFGKALTFEEPYPDRNCHVCGLGQASAASRGDTM